MHSCIEKSGKTVGFGSDDTFSSKQALTGELVGGQLVQKTMPLAVSRILNARS